MHTDWVLAELDEEVRGGEQGRNVVGPKIIDFFGNRSAEIFWELPHRDPQERTRHEACRSKVEGEQ